MAKFKVIWSRRVKIGTKYLAPIVALKTFTTINGCTVKKGDLGGLVESPYNLSQLNLAWIEEGAIVEGPTYIGGNTYIGKGYHLKEGTFYMNGMNGQILDPGDLLENYEKQKEEKKRKKEQVELDKFIDGVCDLFSKLKSK